jgi:hypothetical protein
VKNRFVAVKNSRALAAKLRGKRIVSTAFSPSASAQCESFRYFGGKAAIEMAAQRPHIDIVEGLEGMLHRHIHCSQKTRHF